MILNRIFGNKANGFFVDVGAHHPHRFSNTYFFYKKGWRGINIEPNPDALKAFQRYRARDKNLQLGVADIAASLTYYSFDEPALNTFDEDLVNVRLATTPYKLKATSKIMVERLDQILEKHLEKNTHIDFLSIDVEGLDFAVLKSNDWARFRPTLVLVEALQNSFEDVMLGEVFQFMKKHQYELFAKTFNTLIFREKRLFSLVEKDGVSD